MKQLEAEITITYKWWNDDGDVPSSVAEELNERATNHIHEVAVNSCICSGELLTEINGVDYRGWWYMNIETTERGSQ